MSKNTKNDLVPDHHKPAKGQGVQPVGYSGFQSAEKFSNTGSTDQETSITKDQRK